MVPNVLPNKPTVVGLGSGNSGEGVPQGYFKNPNSGLSGGASSSNLPVLNNPFQSSVAKNSAIGANRNKSVPPGIGSYGGIGASIIGGGAGYKYAGVGGGIGGSGLGGGDYGSANYE